MNTNVPEMDPEILEYLESMPRPSQAELDALDEISLEEIIKEFSGQQIDEEMEVENDNINESVSDVNSKLEERLATAQLELIEYEKKTAEKKDEIKMILRDLRKLEKDSKQREVPKGKLNVSFQPKCKFYERGFCKNREWCKFRHPSKKCKKYENSKCDEGIRCESRHPQKDCLFWMRGDCLREDKCLFRHDRAKHDNKNNNVRNNKHTTNPIYANSEHGNICLLYTSPSPRDS